MPPVSSSLVVVTVVVVIVIVVVVGVIVVGVVIKMIYEPWIAVRIVRSFSFFSFRHLLVLIKSWFYAKGLSLGL